jgi:hypothetical protein
VVTAASTLTQLGQGGLAIAAVALSIERIGSPSDGALVVTSFAVGSLLGALCETVRPSRARPQAVMMAGFLATGLLTVGAAVDIGTAWTVVAIGLSGVFMASTAAAMLFLRNRLSGPGSLRHGIRGRTQPDRGGCPLGCVSRADGRLPNKRPSRSLGGAAERPGSTRYSGGHYGRPSFTYALAPHSFDRQAG